MVAPAPSVEPIIPVEPPQPIKPVKAAPLPKPPKPKKEKPPKDPVDVMMVWPPWVLAILGTGSSAFRDFGFEAAPAALWGIAGWALGFMVRLSRLYPMKPFAESSLEALSAQKDSHRVVPVLLKGQIVLAKEEDPKGNVVLKRDERAIELNRMGRWDIVPRLFGLSNPRQLLKGEVTVKGWYHPGLIPFVEVHEVRTEKTVRKSMSRSLRWASAVMIL